MELSAAMTGAGTSFCPGARLQLNPDHLVRVDAGAPRVCPPVPTGYEPYASGAYPRHIRAAGLELRGTITRQRGEDSWIS
jgi:hypothetical protein